MALAKKHTGGALLTALFIMTLVAIVATAMSMRLQLDIYRTNLTIVYDKLYLASQAVTFWGLDALNNKDNRFNKLTDQGMVAKYPQKLEALPNNIIVTGGLYDLQALFNLNNLLDQKRLGSFVKLINLSYPKATNSEAKKLALALKDWLTPYELSRGKDSYTSYYLSQKPPYYPSHQLMQSRSELRLIQDANADFFQAIEPLVSSLPETTPININTAPKQVLMTLGNGLSESQANEIVLSRGENGIDKMDSISELLTKLDLPKEQLSIESQYFLSIAKASTDNKQIVVYALLKRVKDNKNNFFVSVLRESMNTF